MISIDKKKYIMHPNLRLRVYHDYDPEGDLYWRNPACRRCGVLLFRGERHICSVCRAEVDKMMVNLPAVCI
jgi:hypothetical protein